MSIASSGKIRSPEQLAKMSASAKKKWEDPDFRNRVTSSLSARLMDPNVRAGIRAKALLREPRVLGPETKAKIAESVRAHFAARRR
jgi:hypothetical protein